MKKSNIKMQLGAMNEAITEFAGKQAKKQDLSPKDINVVKQRVMYGEPYNNMEVIRSNKLYKTMIDRAEVVIKDIEQIKNEEEE